jgi:hypothetical protein
MPGRVAVLEPRTITGPACCGRKRPQGRRETLVGSFTDPRCSFALRIVRRRDGSLVGVRIASAKTTVPHA